MTNLSNLSPDDLTLDLMRERAALIASCVNRTPCVPLETPALQPLLEGGSLFLKLECFQKTGTFKARGAISVALDIPHEALKRGITAASAGNHAIAAAWAARHVGAHAKVVMMASANPFRVARARELGAEVVIIEGSANALAEAERLADVEGLTYIHPFEGPLTTLGAAGVGLEIAEDICDLEAVIVAVGGGGLISGVGAAIKQINPACRVYGVEPMGACSMSKSFAAGRPMAIKAVTTLADSLGAPAAMPFSFEVCRANVDRIVTVNDDEICAGVALYQEEAKLAVEPAAGAALAAALGPLRGDIAGKKTAIVVCGANIDAKSYGEVLARGREALPNLLKP